MNARDRQSDATSSVVKAEILTSANSNSDTNHENAQPCGEDDHLPEERKKMKKNEKKRIDLAVSSNYEATPGIMEEIGNEDLVVRKAKKGKQRSEEQEDAKVSDKDLMVKEDNIKESIEPATKASEVNPTHAKKKKKENHGGEDLESQTTCNGDANVRESNVEPVLKISSETGTVEADVVVDLSFSKKKKKGKHRSEEVQAPKVAVLGIDDVEESVNLTSTRASNFGTEEGDAPGERILILSKKKMKKLKHSNGEAEFQEFCSGDSLSADGGATHSKKKKKKEKNHSVEMEGAVISPAEVLDMADPGETQVNDEFRSRLSKKRKKENNYSKETDGGSSREGDGICHTEGPDCRNQDAEPDEMKSGQSRKKKKKSFSEETDDNHCGEEGGRINLIKALDCCDRVTELDMTRAIDEMKSARPKKRKKEKRLNALADAQPQTGEHDNELEKGGSSAAHGPEFVQKNLTGCCIETSQGSHREKEGHQHGMKGTNGGSCGFSLKEKKKKHHVDENTDEGRESGNVVDECHSTKTNYEDNLSPLEKKRGRKKSKRMKKQQACAEESNTEKALATDSQAVELVMEHAELCVDNSVGTRTRSSGESSLVPSEKKKKNEKKRRKENEDQPLLVEDGNMRGTLTDPSFKGDHTELVDWPDHLAHHSCESKRGSGRRSFHKRQDCWLRIPKENSAKEDLFHSYLVKGSSSEPPESGTAPDQIFKVEQKIEATTMCSCKDDFSLEDSEEKIQKQKKQVDGVSTSSLLYMSAGVSICEEINPNVGSSSTGAAVGHSRKKLLILDVNGILVDIVPVVSGNYKPDFVLSRKPVFKRPFMDDFLQFCFENFSVGFWSSRIRKNLNQIVNFLLGDSKSKLLFCWDQSHCTKTGFQTVENRDKPLVLKEIRKLWDKIEPDLPWRKGDYNESNTLLLDDSPYKALLNPANTGIFPYSYHYTNAEDNSLGPAGDLRVYLERLAKADNTQSFVRDNPFGQEAITESSASWKFYERVIGQISKGENLPQDVHHPRSRYCSPRREYPRHDDTLPPPPPRECLLPLLPQEARRSLSPQTQPQPQPPQDTRYPRSLQREYLPYDDRFFRPPTMAYPLGEITQPLFPRQHQDGWHSHPHYKEYSHQDVRLCHPPPREYQLPETNQPYWDTRHYHPLSPWPYQDTRHYQPPWREYGHRDDSCQDDRRYRFDDRSVYGPRPRWH